MFTECDAPVSRVPGSMATVRSQVARLLPPCRTLFAACCLCVLTASSGMARELERVTVVLQWQHQAQFAGYYMAQAKGYYAQRGLDVRIMRGGPDVRVGERLRAGEADFGSLMLCTALNERARGVSLVHLTQVVNRGNFLLVAWRNPAEGSTIGELADLDRRSVSLWLEDFRAPYLALFHARDVRPSLLPQYNTFSLFLHRGVDAFAGMRYNEFHTLLQSGIGEDEVRVFALRDYGIQLPEDGLYAMSETWQRRPRICKAFVRASLDGWRYARDYSEETLDVVMQYINEHQLPTNRAHMRWMLKEIIASVFPGPEDRWTVGRLSGDDYEAALKLLTRHADLQDAPSYDAFVVGEAVNE